MMLALKLRIGNNNFIGREGSWGVTTPDSCFDDEYAAPAQAECDACPVQLFVPSPKGTKKQQSILLSTFHLVFHFTIVDEVA